MRPYVSTLPENIRNRYKANPSHQVRLGTFGVVLKNAPEKGLKQQKVLD